MKKPSRQSSSSENEEFTTKSDNSVDSDDSEHHRTTKKGGKKGSEHFFKGLNAQEIRRFVRSYRKFPLPLTKIDVIAQDAHLEEKSQACLIEFAKKVQTVCKVALADFEASGKLLAEEDSNGLTYILIL